LYPRGQLARHRFDVVLPTQEQAAVLARHAPYCLRNLRARSTEVSAVSLMICSFGPSSSARDQRPGPAKVTTRGEI
jgi:hypothetical protein